MFTRKFSLSFLLFCYFTCGVISLSAQEQQVGGGQQQPGASQGQGESGPLGKAEELAREHVDKVLKEAPDFIDGYGKKVAKKAAKDGKQGKVAGIEGPKEHPWAAHGNPNSQNDYFYDSMFNLDARDTNQQNFAQAWSCFEPKLLANAKDGTKKVDNQGPGNTDLIEECRRKCPHHSSDAPGPTYIEEERGDLRGAVKYAAMGCVADPDKWGYIENGYEIVEFWYPEYQIEINNFGINRIKPDDLSGTGQQFTRKKLLAAKKQADQQIKKELGDTSYYDIAVSDYKDPNYSDDRLKGQGAWGGYASPDFQDKSFGHVVRTWLGTSQNEDKIETQDGWEVDPERSYLDALPKRTEDHDPVIAWTEHGMFNAITSIPHLSSKIRPKIMEALFGEEKTYNEKAKEETPFYQNTGAAAYRLKKWGDIYGGLEHLEIESGGDDILKEVVYKGGYELFPLVTNHSGFAVPALAAAAITARRVLYLVGARAPVETGGDDSGTIKQAFVQGEEKGRMITYTINSQDKSREIDKMQLISPKRPKDGTTDGGEPPTVSECFRSQNIPNYINDDKGLQKWVDENMPRKLVGYFSDKDGQTIQGGSVTFTYWNRRIGCFCERCGIPTGASTISDGGDGDKLYDKPRQEYCRYPENPMTAWSAWEKEDTFDKCEQNGKNKGTADGRGLEDKV